MGSHGKGFLAGVDLVQHQSKRVHVASDRRSPARQLLRRHVSRRPCNLSRLGFVFGRDSETEIRDANAAVSVEHDVGWLQIAVQHSALMHGCEPGGKREAATIADGRLLSVFAEPN
jgi:hypothetical protein